MNIATDLHTLAHDTHDTVLPDTEQGTGAPGQTHNAAMFDHLKGE